MDPKKSKQSQTWHILPQLRKSEVFLEWLAITEFLSQTLWVLVNPCSTLYRTRMLKIFQLLKKSSKQLTSLNQHSAHAQFYIFRISPFILETEASTIRIAALLMKKINKNEV